MNERETYPVVPFTPFRCPECGADKPRTYGVNRNGYPASRYHECIQCGTRYRSLEVHMEDWPSFGDFAQRARWRQKLFPFD